MDYSREIIDYCMYLYGASGHAKVIIDILRSRSVEVEGLIDDNLEINELMGYPVLHGRLDLSPMIVSIGNNETRKLIVEKLQYCLFGSAIHASAIISPCAQIGEGTVIMQNTVINSCSRIGKHCIINTSASIDHECVIQDYVHISPNVALCGNVFIGEGTQIGVGSCVVPGVRIGKWSLVRAGSVVTGDIPDYCIAGGNTCKVIKYKDMIENMLTWGG